jgi:hypothetical protein
MSSVRYEYVRILRLRSRHFPAHERHRTRISRIEYGGDMASSYPFCSMAILSATSGPARPRSPDSLIPRILSLMRRSESMVSRIMAAMYRLVSRASMAPATVLAQSMTRPSFTAA